MMWDVNDFLTDVKINPKRKVKLPCDKCDGDCCGPIPMEKAFIDRMWSKYSLEETLGPISEENFIDSTISGTVRYHNGNRQECIFKTSKGCSIYEDRPVICKVYGETYIVRCPYENLDKQPECSDKRRELTIKKSNEEVEILMDLAKKFNKV